MVRRSLTIWLQYEFGKNNNMGHVDKKGYTSGNHFDKLLMRPQHEYVAEV